jgi:hypothetical protein
VTSRNSLKRKCVLQTCGTHLHLQMDWSLSAARGDAAAIVVTGPAG